MSKDLVFDKPHATQFVEARQAFLRKHLPELQASLGLRTALDVGCGVGYFSQFLYENGLQVTGLDGREENVKEAQRRVAGVQFVCADVEDLTVRDVGSFDLVLCFGLLYHLENPFRAIRNLFSLTGKLLLVESMCLPEQRPVLYLQVEPEVEDQALHRIAFYPSEGGLVAMLYQAAFRFVYQFSQLPDHVDFCGNAARRKSRIMLAASRVPLSTSELVVAKEPTNPTDPWSWREDLGIEILDKTVPAAGALEHTADKNDWPPIVLVTPVLNSAAYIEQTIQSVISQRYPNLEYFIIDGGSTDGTVEIIRAYEKEITGWISEPDGGMYDALNKGFAMSPNEVMGWISATDILQPRGLFVVGSVFRTFPEVEWITGTPTVVDESGTTIEVRPVPHWSRVRFLAGANKYIQQESTFWRRSLWEKAGGYLDASRRIASDFELWVRFFRHARLYSVSALIGAYRAHADSIGLQDLSACHRVHSQVIDAELESLSWGRTLKRVQKVSNRLEVTPKLGFFWQHFVRFLRRSLYATRGPDWPPIIEYVPGRGWVKNKSGRRSFLGA